MSEFLCSAASDSPLFEIDPLDSGDWVPADSVVETVEQAPELTETRSPRDLVLDLAMEVGWNATQEGIGDEHDERAAAALIEYIGYLPRNAAPSLVLTTIMARVVDATKAEVDFWEWNGKDEPADGQHYARRTAAAVALAARAVAALSPVLA